jgi:hypothetical protein
VSGQLYCFTSGEREPSTHWIGGWVDPRAGLDDVEKRKFLTLLGLNFDPLVVQPVASCYTDYAIPAPLLVTHTRDNMKMEIGFVLGRD